MIDVFELKDLDFAPRIRELQEDVDTLQCCQISAALVDDNSIWHAIGPARALEKPQRRSLAATISGVYFTTPRFRVASSTLAHRAAMISSR